MAHITLVLKELQISITNGHIDTLSIFRVEDGGNMNILTVLSHAVLQLALRYFP
jgi:hypothetical protein